MKMKNLVSYQSLVHLAKASEIMTSFGFLSAPFESVIKPPVNMKVFLIQ